MIMCWAYICHMCRFLHLCHHIYVTSGGQYTWYLRLLTKICGPSYMCYLRYVADTRVNRHIAALLHVQKLPIIDNYWMGIIIVFLEIWNRIHCENNRISKGEIDISLDDYNLFTIGIDRNEMIAFEAPLPQLQSRISSSCQWRCWCWYYRCWCWWY